MLIPFTHSLHAPERNSVHVSAHKLLVSAAAIEKRDDCDAIAELLSKFQIRLELLALGIRVVNDNIVDAIRHELSSLFLAPEMPCSDLNPMLGMRLHAIERDEYTIVRPSIHAGEIIGRANIVGISTRKQLRKSALASAGK